MFPLSGKGFDGLVDKMVGVACLPIHFGNDV
jgi:hypothetical protein